MVIAASAIASVGALLLVLIAFIGGGTEEPEAPKDTATAFGLALGQFALGQVQDIYEGSRDIYILACINETGVDITSGTTEVVDEALTQLYAIADKKNFEDGDTLSDDWYCCMGGVINEKNMSGESLDGLWTFLDGLGMQFWENIANAGTTLGAAVECTIDPLFDEAASKVADAIARGIDRLGEWSGLW